MIMVYWDGVVNRVAGHGDWMVCHSASGTWIVDSAAAYSKYITAQHRTIEYSTDEAEQKSFFLVPPPPGAHGARSRAEMQCTDSQDGLPFFVPARSAGVAVEWRGEGNQIARSRRYRQLARIAWQDVTEGA